MTPLIVINFKNYKQATGEKGYKLAKYCNKFNNIIVCPQFIELSKISTIKGLRVYSQHADSCSYGAHTGKICVCNIKKAGARGTLLNHSENRISHNQIKETIKMLKKQKMKVIVCCENIKEAGKISKLKPDYIAYEPKELIGGKVSVSDSKPELIKKIVKKVKPIKVLIGAGIKTRQDVVESLELGAKGVLVASGVIKDKNPKKKIKELAGK
jgi:triosephosphate isomerase